MRTGIGTDKTIILVIAVLFGAIIFWTVSSGVDSVIAALGDALR